MEELQLALTVARTDQRNFGIWLRSWQVGHILQALVVEKGPSGDLVLRVGGQLITATADFPVQKGSQLMLQVASVAPTVVLKVMPPQTRVEAGQTIQNNPLNGFIQTLLPRQSSVHSPLAQLKELLDNDKKLTLPDGKTAALQSILQSALVSQSQLGNAQTLKQALMSSGGWSKTDGLKGLLLKLLAFLPDIESAIPEQLGTMRHSLDGALARLTLNQLGTVKAAEQGLQQWLVEIPLQIDGKVQVLQAFINRDASHKSAANPPVSEGWQVELSFETEALGALQADIFLRGDSLSASLYSEQQATVSQLNAALPLLKTRLLEHGFQVPVLACHQGFRRATSSHSFADRILVEKV